MTETGRLQHVYIIPYTSTTCTVVSVSAMLLKVDVDKLCQISTSMHCLWQTICINVCRKRGTT